MNLANGCWLVSLAILECCCVASTFDPAEQIKLFEPQFLSLFGFKGRPQKIDKSKVVVPEEIARIYERQTGLKYSTASIAKKGAFITSANTVRSFVHAESAIDRRFEKHHKFRLKFDLKVPQEETLQAAELFLNRVNLPVDPSAHPYLRVVVEDILKPGVKGKRGPIKRIIDTQEVNSTQNGTISLDLTEAVQRWLQDPKNNHGVLVTVLKGPKPSSMNHVRLKRDADEDERSWSRIEPVLYTYTDDKKNRPSDVKDMVKKRKKRAAKKHGRRKDDSSPCSRHKMFVDFEDVGWSDWIVAPPGYDAYYCHGECKFPLADHLNTTNHAIVQTLMNSMSPMTVPKACCVPTQLNSISMLYLDIDNKVVLKNYKEMVVIGCGCR